MFKEYDEFDLAIALYHWLQHNWLSQNDELYADFCILTKPDMLQVSGSLEFFDNINENASEIYNMLTRDNYKEALEKVLNYKSKE